MGSRATRQHRRNTSSDLPVGLELLCTTNQLEGISSSDLKNIFRKHLNSDLTQDQEQRVCAWLEKLFVDFSKWNRIDFSRQVYFNFGMIFTNADRAMEYKRLAIDVLTTVMPKYVRQMKQNRTNQEEPFLKELCLFNSNLEGQFPPRLDLLDTLQELGVLVDLEELDVSVNNLTSLDETWFVKLSQNGTPKLKKLTLSGNMFEDLNMKECERICFPHLRTVYVNNNIMLKSFPRWLCFQNQITQLKFAECQIGGFLPKDIFLNLVNLKVLDLLENQVEGFEEINGEQEALTLALDELSLAANRVKYLPSSIFNGRVMANLKQLLLSENFISELPESISELKLRVLYLDHNNLSALPKSFSNLSETLSELNLGFNCFTEFPATLLELENLQSLNLTNNMIEEIPLELISWKKLCGLQALFIPGNKLKKLPQQWISNEGLSELQRLNCGFNQLTDFDIFSPFEQCKLRQLILTGNRITDIPDNFIETVKGELQVLYLGHNSISQLDGANISKISKLVHLSLCFNCISGSLEDILTRLNTPTLKFLNLEGNQINLCGEATAESRVSHYRKQLSQNELKECKVAPQRLSTGNPNRTSVTGHVAFCNGTVRPEMEDAHLVIENEPVLENCLLSLYGIFDGHAGNDVSNWMADNYSSICLKTFPKDALELHEVELVEKFKQWMASSLLLADEKCFKEHGNEYIDGCTAVVCAIIIHNTDRFVIFGNVGDARAIMRRFKEGSYITERMTYDHKPHGDPSEVLRIRSVGGYVINGRTMGAFGVARSIGDWEDRPYLSAEPYVTGCKLSNEGSEKTIIVMGCDGVWDVLSDQAAMDAVLNYRIVRSDDMDGDAAWVRDFSHASGSTDNISSMVIYV